MPNEILLCILMSTLSQCLRTHSVRRKKSNSHRTPRLWGCPAARGLVVRVCVMNPKKPNSAMRHVAKVKLYSKPRVTARIPGCGFGVTRFNRVLVRGGRANDLPGVSYSLVRGVYDFPSLYGKKKDVLFMAWLVPRKRKSTSAVSFEKNWACRDCHIWCTILLLLKVFLSTPKRFLPVERGMSRIRVGSYPTQLSAILRFCIHKKVACC